MSALDAMAAVSARGRHLEIFRVHGGRLQHRWWLTEEPNWTPWHPLDSPENIVAVAAAATSDDSITLFALTHAGQMYVRWWTLENWWGEWESLGGPVYPPITATSLRWGHLEIYALSGDDRVVSRYLTGEDPWRWAEWQVLADESVSDA